MRLKWDLYERVETSDETITLCLPTHLHLFIARMLPARIQSRLADLLVKKASPSPEAPLCRPS